MGGKTENERTQEGAGRRRQEET